MRQLALIQGDSTPVEGSLYYAFDDPYIFGESLVHDAFMTIAPDNYRIETGIIRVKSADGEEYNRNLEGATYALDYDDETKFIRAYYVRSVSWYAGYYMLRVELDLWHTYIGYAKFHDTRITRCNYPLANGFLDDIEAVDGSKEIVKEYIGEQYQAAGSCTLVMQVSRVIPQGTLGGSEITKVELFAIDLSYMNVLYSQIPELPEPAGNYSPVELAVDFAGGIIGFETGGSRGKAEVTKAWLVPTHCIKSAYREISQIDYINAVVHPAVAMPNTTYNIAIFRLLPSKISHDCTIEGWDIQKDYYLGKYPTGLHLKKSTDGNIYASILFIVGNDDVKVVARQGDNMQDITDAYSLFVSSNGSTDTSLKAMSRYLPAFATSLLAVGGNLAAGNVGGAVASGAGGAISLLAKNVNAERGNGAIGSGDGYDTWYVDPLERPLQVNSPFYVTTFVSLSDETARVNLCGAPCDIMTDFNYLWLLNVQDGDLIAFDPDAELYIACDTHVGGVPLDACEAIEEAFHNGIHLRFFN